MELTLVYDLSSDAVLSTQHPFLVRPPRPWILANAPMKNPDPSKYFGVLCTSAKKSTALPWASGLWIVMPNLAVDMVIYWEQLHFQQMSTVFSPNPPTKAMSVEWALVALDVERRLRVPDGRELILTLESDQIILRRQNETWRGLTAEARLGHQGAAANLWIWLFRGFETPVQLEWDHPLVGFGTHPLDFQGHLPSKELSNTEFVQLAPRFWETACLAALSYQRIPGGDNEYKDSEGLLKKYYFSLSASSAGTPPPLRIAFMGDSNFLFTLLQRDPKSAEDRQQIAYLLPLYRHFVVFSCLPVPVANEIMSNPAQEFKIPIGHEAKGGHLILTWTPKKVLVIRDYVCLDDSVIDFACFKSMLDLIRSLVAHRFLHAAAVHRQFSEGIIEPEWPKDHDYIFINGS